MEAKRVMPSCMIHTANQILKPKRIMFKSERIQLNTKAKELLTKYRKGLIWKDNG